MRKLFFVITLLISLRSAARPDTMQVWNKQKTWALAAHTSSLSYSGNGSGMAYGARLDYFFTDYFSLRNRYLVGQNYFKFSLGPMLPVLAGSGWIADGDNDINGDSAVTCGESIKGPIFRTLITTAMLIGCDGVQGHIPIGNHITISPFISPAEMYFSRVPGANFEVDAFTTFGCGLFAHSLSGDFFAGVEGEYVRRVFFTSKDSGYRVSLTAGWCFNNR
jgi:hypothetical protein